jgi:hypothetical protein
MMAEPVAAPPQHTTTSRPSSRRNSRQVHTASGWGVLSLGVCTACLHTRSILFLLLLWVAHGYMRVVCCNLAPRMCLSQCSTHQCLLMC